MLGLHEFSYSSYCCFLRITTVAKAEGACSKGHIRVVKILVTEHKADVNSHSRDNETPLYEAALGGHAYVVKCLIEEFGCSQYVTGFKGRTILHQACHFDHIKLTELLVESYDLSLLSTDKDGNTPLHITAIKQVCASTFTEVQCSSLL